MFSSPQARNLLGCFRRSIASLYNHFYNCSSHFGANNLETVCTLWDTLLLSKTIETIRQKCVRFEVFSGVS